MLIALKHLPPNFREQLHNEEVASELFPKIMDRSYQAPHNAISGWCQYIRPNGVSFWVYADDNGAVCIETEAVRNATNMTTIDRDFDINTSKNELTRFLEQIAPWLLDCDFKQRIIQSSQSVSLFFLENDMVRWIFRVWGPKRWLFCNPEYDYM
jgi:hypothetical protein